MTVPRRPSGVATAGISLQQYRHPLKGLEGEELAVDAALDPVGHKVKAIVNYDRFSILPELIDDYIAMVKGVVERHYHDVTRYTASTFLRMKLGEALERQRIAPRLYPSADEAQGNLGKPAGQ